ncbi:ABC transporter substrate-binding protein [Roseiflexus castenholzii]|uniref:ABC transporter substrate-binding protein n=1 Tax=Roseiflexus castenholzii TaxID=120962 RepID=UPI003C7A6F7F
MSNARKLNRRTFLRLSAVTAASAAIAACGGGGQPATAPTTAPAAPQPTTAPAAPAPTTPPAATAVPPVTTQYKEAPMLAKLVQEGKLPPVDERLPKNPYTPPHSWLTVGKYGGVLKKTYNNNWGITGFIHEMQYGSSPLRWLKDGLAIGPGFVESWESNADASKWTFKIREGIKWSDGQPFTTKDIMYWWEYTVGGNGKEKEYPAGLKPINSPPDEARSGTGTLMTLNAPDDYTFEMVFDAPAPLTADRLAMWVNMFIGPAWVIPRHYMEQFNPVLNPDKYKDWEEHQRKFNHNNPDCPRLTGWKLDIFEEGVRAVWSRNPYYWAVDKEGNQLPYIDQIIVTAVKDKEIEKLAYTEGRADHAHFHSQGLADVQSLRDAEAKSGLEVRFWDSGSGTGSLYFFNMDFKDPKMRAVFRDPKFRQALSHAYNRADVQKAVYFGLGELTTGTFSPKAIEYNINDQGKQVYAAWRDSYVKYDPALAEQILDEAGYKKGPDGKRTMPDGSPLQIQITYGADQAPGGEHLSKNERLARDWQAIGIDAVLTPIPGEGADEKWRAGELPMKTTWEVGDGPNHLVFPSWLVADETERWAPLHGRGYTLRGTASEKEELDKNPWDRNPPRINRGEPDYMPAIGKLHELFDKSKVEPDAMKRHQLVWDMIKVHIEEGPFFTGTIANPPRIILVKKGLMNVPTRDDLLKEGLGGFVNPWIIPSPATYDPETWYWDNPEAHTA